MVNLIKRYKGFLIVLVCVGLLTIFNRGIGIKAISISARSFLEMLFIIPPVFVLLGLLDVWVPRESMVKYMQDVERESHKSKPKDVKVPKLKKLFGTDSYSITMLGRRYLALMQL